MSREKYGIVYIWYDRKHKRFYIGCHWGKKEDTYICSSTWMRNSYKRRPQDFKRKILSIVENRDYLLDEEYRWLQMIKSEELGIRYYNLNKNSSGHWSSERRDKMKAAKLGKWTGPDNPNYIPEIREKITKSTTGKKRTPEQIEYMCEQQKKRFQNGFESWNKGTKGLMKAWNKGKKLSEEHKANLRKPKKRKETLINTFE